MSSDYNGKRTSKSSGVLHSFRYALQGIIHAFLKERNMKIHVVISILVMIVGMAVKLTPMEWLFIVFAIGGVITLELLNTAIERLVDLVTPDFHPLAKQAKDVSAGAVLIFSIVAVIIGLIIFIPKIF